MAAATSDGDGPTSESDQIELGGLIRPPYRNLPFTLGPPYSYQFGFGLGLPLAISSGVPLGGVGRDGGVPFGGDPIPKPFGAVPDLSSTTLAAGGSTLVGAGF